MSLTRTQEIPAREHHTKKWSRKALTSSVSQKVAQLTKSWSIFSFFLFAALVGTFILELATQMVSVTWYIIVYLLIVATVVNEFKPIEKQDEKTTKKN